LLPEQRHDLLARVTALEQLSDRRRQRLDGVFDTQQLRRLGRWGDRFERLSRNIHKVLTDFRLRRWLHLIPPLAKKLAAGFSASVCKTDGGDRKRVVAEIKWGSEKPRAR
jgi:hypothetical protein